MTGYVVRRLLLLPLTLLGVSILVFAVLRITPGDPAEVFLFAGGERAIDETELAKLRQIMGLNKPLYQQYLDWLWGIGKLEGGRSLLTKTPVFTEIKERLPLTLQLALMSVFISLTIALPIGVIAAVKQDTYVDYVVRVFAIAGIALPSFWTGIVLILVMVVFFDWYPPLGFAQIWQDPSTNLQKLIWPALILGYLLCAISARMIRSQMLEVLRQDYIRTAWAKGLKARVVVLRHALKNAMLPVITIVGLQLAGLLGGTVIMEQLFNLPGIGSRFLEAIRVRDFPVVQTLLLLFAFFVVVANLLVDLMYALFNPLIRYR